MIRGSIQEAHRREAPILIPPETSPSISWGLKPFLPPAQHPPDSKKASTCLALRGSAPINLPSTAPPPPQQSGSHASSIRPRRETAARPAQQQQPLPLAVTSPSLRQPRPAPKTAEALRTRSNSGTSRVRGLTSPASEVCLQDTHLSWRSCFNTCPQRAVTQSQSEDIASGGSPTAEALPLPPAPRAPRCHKHILSF